MPIIAGGKTIGAIKDGAEADVVRHYVQMMVLYATGSAARQTVATNNRPCDAVIMAIVDSWEVGGEERYHKHR